VTRVLLVINVAIFVLGLVPSIEEFIFVNGALFSDRALTGESYRLFTSAFLHGGGMHILFNMYALYILGPGLERRVGSAPFASLYVASALAGGTAFALMNGGLAVGASGAIFGLFGAYLVIAFERRDTPMGNAQLRSIVAILALNAVIGFVIPNVAWEGHLGGFLAGAVISAVWSRLRQSPRDMVLTGVVVAIGAILGVMI
jgi:membrane associated rhomboid family serine protease